MKSAIRPETGAHLTAGCRVRMSADSADSTLLAPACSAGVGVGVAVGVGGRSRSSRRRTHGGRRALLPLGFVLLVAAGCDRTDARPHLVASDSLGIEILTLDAALLPAGASIGVEPEWIVGAGDTGIGNVELHQVVDVAMLTDDVLLIGEGSTQQILRIHIDSGTVQHFGGRGDGPAEFQALAALDGLGGWDSRRRRLVAFDEDGRVQSEWALPIAVDPNQSVRLVQGPGGTRFAAILTGLSPDSAGTWRGEAPLYRLGTPPDTITLIRGNTTFQSDIAMGAVIFGATTVVAGSPSGIWVGDNAKRQVVLWSDPGSPERIVRWNSRESLQVTDAHKDDFVGRVLDASPEAPPPEFRSMLHFSDRLPAFSALAVSTGGDLWIGSHIPPHVEPLQEPWPEQEWMVVDPASRTATRVTTPAGFRLYRAGDDYVLGVHRDEWGVETVRRHRLDALPQE